MLYNGNKQDILDMIKHRMIDAHMEQSDIVKVTGLAKSTVSNFLGGRNPNPTLDTLKAYADAIGCDLHIDFVPRKTED